MNILTALTYYRPYVSGQTLYAARLAEALAECGHQVTVLTSRYDPALPRTEVVNGVNVVRMDVAMRLGKGPLMPALLLRGWNLARRADLIHLHLPQFDAALLAKYGFLLRKPVVLTYHCDLSLPPGLVNRIAGFGSALASMLSVWFANVIVTNTQDYAAHSPILSRYLDKVVPILPPVEITSEQSDRSQPPRPAQTSDGPVIGMVGRLAAEKGAETLAAALMLVRQQFPKAVVHHVGEHENVPGEEPYIMKVNALVAGLNASAGTPAWRFLGRLSDADLTAFFDTCDLTVLPSLNRTESFGMVQLESMARGAPVVASDLPGVRQPVQMTGMGEVVAPGDPEALARAILRILDQPAHYRNPATEARRDEIIQAARPENVAAAYENLFNAL